MLKQLNVIAGGRGAGRVRRMFRQIAPEGLPLGRDMIYYFTDSQGNPRRVLWKMDGEVVSLEALPGIMEEAS
jgi:hypothetical protein